MKMLPLLFRHNANLFRRRGIVLMYHRIADVAADPWQLAVSPDNFAQQLQVLQKKYAVLSVGKLLNGMRNGKMKQNSVCLTFDDGYSDNYFVAKNLLEQYNCPATFFIATGYIGCRHSFWWDELARIFLSPVKLPSSLSLSIYGQLLRFDIGDEILNEQQLRNQCAWVWPDAPLIERCKIYLDLWTRLRPLGYHEIKSVMDEIKRWAGATVPAGEESFPMTGDQLGEIIKAPLFDAGLHTVTHPALAFHPAAIQRAEIAPNIEYFNKQYGKCVNVIAYPYGNYNDVTLSVLKEQNITAAFTTENKAVCRSSDPLQLGRFQVRNWDGEAFDAHLREWIKAG